MDRARSSAGSEVDGQPRAAEQRYRLLFDVIDEGALVVEVDDKRRPTGISEANDAVCRRLGYSRPDLVGRQLSEVAAPESWAATASAISRVVDAGGGAFDATLVTSLGTSLHMTAHAEAYEDGGGKLLVLFRDVGPGPSSGSDNEPPSAEDLALFSRTASLFVDLQPEDDVFPYVAQGLKQMLGPSVILLSSLDPSTKLFQLEQIAGVGRHWGRLSKLLGFDPHTMTIPMNEDERPILTNQRLNVLPGGLDRVTYGLLPGPVGRGIESLLGLDELYGMGFSREGEVFGSLLFWVRRGGRLRNAALVEAFVNLASVALHRQRTWAALRESRRQLTQAQKMDAVGRLASGVAHDFNNLLTVIMGSSELVLAKRPGDDPAVPLLDQIIRASEDAAALTAQLLAFSRRELSEPEVFELNRQVTRLEKMLGRLLPANVRLEVTHPLEDVFLYMDRVHLELILLNLTVNARDAMPDGGKIALRVESLDGDGEAGELSTPAVRLSVTDGGLGMTPEIQAQVFEPFFTTKERGRGTGLGLATVYDLVAQYGGRIEVASEPDEGTTFTVLLPRSSTDEGEATVRPTAFPPPTGTETVLLIEDQRVLRSLLATALQHFGYRVVEAATGEEGVQAGEEHGRTIDLVVTDQMLPGISGIEAARLLRASRPGLPVLFMTGCNEDLPRHERPEATRDRTLRKPFTPTALARAAREALAQPESE